MKKSVTKKIACLLIILICIVFNFVIINANAYDWRQGIDNTTNRGAPNEVIDPLKGFAGTFITIVRVISVGVAIIMLVVLGIKYMTAAPSDKAAIMKHAWVYIVGAFVLFASTGIIELIAKFAAAVNNN